MEFRLGYQDCRDLLVRRLEEPAPGRVQLLTGPRQVGKTTLLLDLADRFGPVAIYAAADAPEAALPGFVERLFARAEDTAASHGKAVVLFDEAHLVTNWGARLKGFTDRLRRRRTPVHIVATGSSALRLVSGSRETMAGRFERLTLTHWSASSVASVFGLSPRDAAESVVRMGAYPGAYALQPDVPRWSAYVRDAILEPAIGRDILALAAVRRPALLRQIFGIASSSPAQIITLQKLQAQLQDRGALETIAHYLELLEDAFLVAALPKYARHETRRRSSPPKLVTLSNAFLAVMDPLGIPNPDSDPQRFGRWLENACLAYAWNCGQTVSYWREEPSEIDAVIEGTWGSWAIEVKSGVYEPGDIRALLEFTRREPAFRPLIVCGERERVIAERSGVRAVAWQDFLLDGPPKGA